MGDERMTIHPAISTAEILDVLRDFLSTALGILAWPVIVYFILINTSYLVLITLAWMTSHRHRRWERLEGVDHLLSSERAGGISLIVPAYNEEVGIVESVRSLLALAYPDVEVVVVNDGSTDGTLELMIDRFSLIEVASQAEGSIPTRAAPAGTYIPRSGRGGLVVVDKPNSGRSDAINVGINHASKDLVAIVDADSVLEASALLRVTQPFLNDPLRCIGSGGSIRPINHCVVDRGRVLEVRMSPRYLPRIQAVEYIRAFILGRQGWARARALLLISGAFGVFRRDVVLGVDGLDPDSIGEDLELVTRLHGTYRRSGTPYSVGFVAEPTNWTEVPPTIPVLARQRRRWHRGLWEVLWKHRRMCLNPRYGRIGMVAIPYYWLFELIAPLLEVIGIVAVPLGVALGVVHWQFALLFVLVAYVYGFLVSLAAIVVDTVYFNRYPRGKDIRRAVVATVAENFGYRQMTAVWRLQGWWAALRGKKAVWGVMSREGFGGSNSSK